MNTSRFAIGLTFVLTACSGSQPADRVAEPLDAEAYRPHLVLLDAIVFEDMQLAPESQLMLAESVERFARDVTMEGDHPETALALSEELGVLLGKVQEATGKHLEDSGIREEWLRIRGRFFENAGWFRNSPSDPVADMGPRPRMGESGQPLRDVPGADTLSEVFTTLFIVANVAERDLGPGVEATPGKAKMLSLLTSQLARVDSLLAARREFSDDDHLKAAWTRATEASRLIRIFVASDADTMPGSPGRVALDQAVTQLSVGMEELEKVGS